MSDKDKARPDGPLLSIVIPTFNRFVVLGSLLHDIGRVLVATEDLVEVVICDNASDDGTESLTREFAARWPSKVRVLRRHANIGMEGNIANSMMAACGKYTWLLSDHQRLFHDNVMSVIRYLREANFDIGYAKIAQWDTVLTYKFQGMSWSELSNLQKGSFFFYAGNIAGLIYRSDLALLAASWIFRSCGWNYPHLGIVSALRPESRVIEFPDMTALPEGEELVAVKREYDSLQACFVNHIECLDAMFLIAGLQFSRRWFSARGYKRAFLSNAVSILANHRGPTLPICRRLLTVARANRGFVRYAAFTILNVMLVLPGPMRRWLFVRLLAAWKKRYRAPLGHEGVQPGGIDQSGNRTPTAGV